MARSFNQVILVGNLARDPELRTIPSGQTVASFAVATNRSWQDSSGETQEAVDFHNITAWGKLAELAGQYLSKGRKVLVAGRLQTRSWEGEDGKKNYRTEVVANEISFLDRAGDGNFNDAEAQPTTPVTKAPAAKGGKKGAAKKEDVSIEDLGDEVDFSEIPF